MKSALLVLGMHRSGTSAITGVLHHLGFSLGEHLLDPATDNPKGYAENAAVVRADELLLEALGRTWDDPRGVSGISDLEPETGRQQDLCGILRAEFGDAPRIALKDPRMCLLNAHWIRALRDEGYRVDVLVVRRHPDAVAQSLDRRDGIHPLIGYALYCRYMLAAMRAAGQGEAFATLDYDAFLADWRGAMRPVLESLEIPEVSLDEEVEARIDAFVDAGMSHAVRRGSHRIAPDTRALRNIAIRIYDFAATVDDWSEIGLDDLETGFSETVGGLREGARARFDTHIRWCRRHQEETRKLRSHFNANLDQLQRTDKGLVEASALALSRLATLTEYESQLRALESGLEAERVALDEARADLKSLSMSELALKERIANLQPLLEQAHADASRHRLGRLRVVKRARALQRTVASLKNRLGDYERSLCALERRAAELLNQSQARLGQAQAWEQKARSLSEALERVTKLSLERLGAMQEREARIAQLEGRIVELASESTERLDELHASEQHVRELMGGLEYAQRLSVDRLKHIEQQESRLAQLETEIGRLAEQSRERLQLAQERDTEALRLKQALDSVTQLSVCRLEEIHRQEDRLREYDCALNNVTELSLRRLADIEGLGDSLREAGNQISDLERAIDMERELHGRTRRQAQRLRGRALRFASEAVNARTFWTWLFRVRLNRRKGP